MKGLWEHEQSQDADWNLHQLNRCHDPKILSNTYTGHIPNVRTENLVGACYGKTLIAAHQLRNPLTQYHFNPHLFRIEHKISNAGIKMKEDRALEAARVRAETIVSAAEHLGIRKARSLRTQASNDATGKAPAHYGDTINQELPWGLDDAEKWLHPTNLCHGLTRPQSGIDPLERSIINRKSQSPHRSGALTSRANVLRLNSPDRDREGLSSPLDGSLRQHSVSFEGDAAQLSPRTVRTTGEVISLGAKTDNGVKTNWSIMDAASRSASVLETTPSQRSTLRPVVFTRRA